jgi:hypothetical protein
MIGRAFGTVLEPVEAVLPAGHRPAVCAELIGEIECVVYVGRLVQLKHWHHIF